MIQELAVHVCCRFLGLMPGYSRNTSSLATKLVSFYPGNAEKGLPTHMAKIVLFDPPTGATLAVIYKYRLSNLITD